MDTRPQELHARIFISLFFCIGPTAVGCGIKSNEDSSELISSTQNEQTIPTIINIVTLCEPVKKDSERENLP